MNQKEKTKSLLLGHRSAHPALLAEDVFKYLYQSTYGCEHLVTDEGRAADYIQKEWEAAPKDTAPLTEDLDGDYARVHLSWLGAGLSPKTLARLFCASAKREEEGHIRLAEKLAAARELFLEGTLTEDAAFLEKLSAWEEKDCPALHHSDTFRREYRPAYRVIAKRYAKFLPLFAMIDRLLSEKGSATVAIDGGAASGKTTLGNLLREIYGASVFHMDDFFLRPSQRTPERLREVGGNVDRERFLAEVLLPLRRRETVTFRPFDCSLWDLGAPVSVDPAPLTVVEGSYSMHPLLAPHYDGASFLDIDPALQRARIEKRNSPPMAKRFFEEWIPLENAYFEGMRVKERCGVHIPVSDS